VLVTLRVLIAGGGLGGLTLAHALRSAGLQPRVFERGPADLDPSLSYRIHIDANGSRALRLCLPPDRWQDFEARSAAAPRGIAFATERLKELAFFPESSPAADPAAISHPISRSGLRQLLLSGLDDVVTFNTRVVGFEQHSDGVELRFADGTSAHGDVLVGADGSASPVRKQLLPTARIVDSGVGGIAGKVYLNERTRELIGDRLLHQMTMVLPVHGFGMFLASFRRRDDRPASASALDLPEHLFWVVIGRTSALGLDGPRGAASSAEMRERALQVAEHWHPLLRQLIAEADVASVQGVPLHTAELVDTWPTTRVTLLGDAIHTMTPLQGLGGNTALQDAAILAHHLIAADRDRSSDLLEAIAAYERDMRVYAYEAVRRSLQVSDAVATTSTVGRLAFRTVLSVAQAVPPLGNIMFKRPADYLPAAA
jgi:2-polyprenyl-6-methoxyphenol hydroxylase-like FAD-dependent oxidoreductase